MNRFSPYVLFPRQVSVDHNFANVTVGNALSVNVSSTSLYCFQTYQNTPAQNDSFYYYVMLDAGTWTMKNGGDVGNNRGIITWTLVNDVDESIISVGTQDWYAAAGAAAIKSITGIVVPKAGRYRLTGQVATKHASSSSYFATLNVSTLVRTGA